MPNKKEEKIYGKESRSRSRRRGDFDKGRF